MATLEALATNQRQNRRRVGSREERENSMRRTHLSPPIERASPNDVVTLATDRGPAPMNIGAVLIIDEASDLDFSTVRSIFEGRLSRVGRLRQRLLKMPFGCGRP